MIKRIVFGLLVFATTLNVKAQDGGDDLEFTESETLRIKEECTGNLYLTDEGARLDIDNNAHRLYFFGSYINLKNLESLEKRYWGEDIIALIGIYPEGTVAFTSNKGDLDYKFGNKIRVFYASKTEFQFSIEGTIITRDNKRFSIDAREVTVKIKKVFDKRDPAKLAEAKKENRDIPSAVVREPIPIPSEVKGQIIMLDSGMQVWLSGGKYKLYFYGDYTLEDMGELVQDYSRQKKIIGRIGTSLPDGYAGFSAAKGDLNFEYGNFLEVYSANKEEIVFTAIGDVITRDNKYYHVNAVKVKVNISKVLNKRSDAPKKKAAPKKKK